MEENKNNRNAKPIKITYDNKEYILLRVETEAELKIIEDKLTVLAIYNAEDMEKYKLEFWIINKENNPYIIMSVHKKTVISLANYRVGFLTNKELEIINTICELANLSIANFDSKNQNTLISFWDFKDILKSIDFEGNALNTR